MIISNEYIDNSKNEKNNIKHKIVIYNVTQKKDITNYFYESDISINRNLKENNSITPNQINLTFNFEKWELENRDLFFNSPVSETDKKFSEYDKRFDEFPTIKGLKLPIIEKDEIIIKDIFNDEEIIVFKGITYSIKLREDINNNKNIKVEIKDKTINSHLTKLSNDLSLRNVYYFNSSDKENSILYILAKKSGFMDEELEIEEIKYKDNEYLIIPTINLKKGTTIMKEIVELVTSVFGNVYVTSNGKLKITSLLNQEDTNKINYEFNENNILNFFEVETVKPINNKVNINYTEYKHLPKQPIFILAGQNADYTTDDAKVIVIANTKKQNLFWKISYITENVTNIDENIEIKVYRYVDGEKQYINNFNNYELDFEKMSLRFWNDREYDVFIEKFKIYGEPIKEIKNNSVSYTEYNLDEINYNTLEINNQYINTHKQAREVAKYTYFKNCREYNLYKFEINSLPFLELEDVVTLNFRSYNNKIQIQSIEQHKDKTIIEAIDYEEYESLTENYESYKTNEYDDSNYINNSYGSIKFDTNKPPRPIDLKAKSEVLGVKLNWQPPMNYKEINGYYLYVEKIEETATKFENKIFVGNVNDYQLKLEVGSYIFRLSTVNLQGIESDLTEEVIAKSLFLTANEIQVDNNTLVFDTLNKIKLGMVYSNNISDRAITEGKVDVEAIRTENIYFGDNCGIRKNYEFDDTGIVYENGKRKTINNKLIFDGNLIFSNDVEFNGKIKSGDSLTVESKDEETKEINKKVVLKNGSIFFEEKNPETNSFLVTRVIKKEKSGLYTYDPNKIRWIDVRDFKTQEWKDITIKAALYSFNVDKDTKRVLCEVVQNPNDKHLFYVKVGTISQIIDYPTTENVTLPTPTSKIVENANEILLYEKIFLSKNKVNVEVPSYVDATFKYNYYEQTTKTTETFPKNFGNGLVIDGPVGIVMTSNIDYIVDRTYKFYTYVSYRKNGTSKWSTPTNSERVDFSNIEGEVDIKVQIKIKYVYSYIKTIKMIGSVPLETEKRLTTKSEDEIVDKLFFKKEKVENYTVTSQSYSSLNMKITTENNVVKITNGGQALWIATEGD